jgi:hypothetical protein
MAFSGNGSLATSEESPQDILNVAGDYGPANSDVRHRFNTDFVIELPFARLGNDGAFTRLLLAGWQTSGLFTANTGGPINVVQTSGFKSSRPDYVGGDAILSNYRDTLQYINPAAFAQVPVAPASGATVRPGNLGRNALYGPGAWNLDLGLAKTLRFTEGVGLQLRADLFNALNHVNYGGVSTNVRNGNFGRVTNGSFRTMQLNMRLSF